MGNVKRTSLNLDLDLVRDASEVLGTERTTDTVHKALREAVRRARLEQLLDEGFPGLTPELMDEIDRGRHDFLEKLRRGEDPYRD